MYRNEKLFLSTYFALAKTGAKCVLFFFSVILVTIYILFTEKPRLRLRKQSVGCIIYNDRV